MTPDDQRKIDRILRIVAGGGTVAEAREASGLSAGQARRVLGFTRERMAALESGATPTAREYAMMAEAFGTEGFTVAHDGGEMPEVHQCADCGYLSAGDEEARHSTFCDGEVPND
jgi:hypothetical protein